MRSTAPASSTTSTVTRAVTSTAATTVTVTALSVSVASILIGAGVRRRRAAASPPVYAGALPTLAGTVRPVVTTDGVTLAVQVHGPAEATATVVLAHGYVQSGRLWARQVEALCQARPDLRVVTYDHRGHGDSGPTTAANATMAQLARDLLVVLDEVAPTGPVVLVGHSMGGMTLMALAEQHPELFGDRVTGVGLVATSSGQLDGLTYGLPAAVAKLVSRQLPRANELARRREAAGKQALAQPFLPALLFGPGAAADDIAATLDDMKRCPAATVADFHLTFGDHDRIAALAALTGVRTIVLVGTRDKLCPEGHSRAIAAALPTAELFVYPGAGHMLQLERAPEVSRRLLELCEVLPRV